MHAEELRAGLALWPKSANAPCVHDLFRFVKRGAGLECGAFGSQW